MRITSRGKVVIGVIAAAAVAGVGMLAFTGHAPGPIQDIVNKITGRPSPCPLTGELRAHGKDAPDRPVMAIKVENSDDAYPLVGLDRADVVYEELVEGGITRFVALFQCQGATRVGPVRSARTTDPKILVQYADQPLLAYSGAQHRVTKAVDKANIVSFTETSANDAYTRDDQRVMPHNLFVNEKVLFRLAKKQGVDFSEPREVFTFSDEVPTPAKKTKTVSAAFSSAHTAEWRWSGGRWTRLLDGSPMELENGKTVTADNLVIQEVAVTTSTILDPAGYPSPTVDLTGTGRAWILRDGRRIAGHWTRNSLGDVTVFETKAGDRIDLAPGTTFVELIPKGTGEVTFA
ncbi:MAG TPA: DUF3048 domain-containing protein [Actinomycetota bacterium]|nr:DUF3048 domain-containing protein [Actinomycetota bacterium]